MEASRNDFLGHYKAISAKLKKRFLRKPNVAEASQNFASLAKELENQECPHYAAFCCLAVARCESSLGNSIDEGQTLVRAARLFLEAEELNHELLCPGFSENLDAALDCYNRAVKANLEQNQVALAASLCLEIGQCLQHLGRTAQAIPHYQKAAELQNHCTLDYLNALELVAECKIKTGDYDGALNVMTEIWVIANEKGNTRSGRRLGVFASLLCSVEITRVLLLLFLQPTSQRLRAEDASLLEKYSWEADEEDSAEDKSMNYIHEDLFLTMQSVVLASQSRDLVALEALEKDLWALLTTQQIDLLHRIIKKLDQKM